MEANSSERHPAPASVGAAVAICVEFLQRYRDCIALLANDTDGTIIGESASTHVTRVAVVALRHIWPDILNTPLPDEEAAANAGGLGRAAGWVRRQFVRPPEEPEEERDYRRFLGMDRDALTAIVSRYFDEHRDELQKLERFAESQKIRRPDIVWLSENFQLPWMGSFEGLARASVRVAWIGSRNLENPHGYGDAAAGDIKFDTHITPFPFVLTLLGLLEEPTYLINAHMYFPWNFDLERYAVTCMLCIAFFEAAKKVRGPQAGKLCVLQYDAIKPISEVAGNGNAAEHFYKRLATTVDAIVYNSNVPSYHTFLEGALGRSIPAAHLYRTQPISPERLKAKQHRRPYVPHKELHVGCVTVQLADFGEPSRDPLAIYMKRFIGAPGVRFHYYCEPERESILRLKREAPREFLDNIEFHPIIRAPGSLVAELEQYHLGVTMFDHALFARAIAASGNRFYGDALAAYVDSTIATSWLVYASAGLPIATNRWCRGLNTFVPESCIFRLTLSELPNLASRVFQSDFASIMDEAEKNRSRLANLDIGDFVSKILGREQGAVRRE
jgi:hypothetical protein